MKIPIILAILGIGIGIGILVITSNDSSVTSSELPNTPSVESPVQEIEEIIQEENLEYDETITIGTIHRDSVKMTKRYLPLANYLAEKLSSDEKIYKGVVHISPSEEEMVNQRVMDVFFDSPLIGMKVAEQTNMESLLLSWKEGERDYHSVFIVPIDSEITFDDLEGKTIVFEDKESTSGYLLPLTHLENSGYSIESDNIDHIFSDDDENTPIWVLEGRGDLGVLSNLDFKDTPYNIQKELKIIEATDSIPRQLVLIKSEMESKLKIKEILLEMNDSEHGKEILEKISRTSKFSEIDHEKDIVPITRLLEMIN
ncbi:phosphate/phosphite/phosphonate ABC transporter substrate-binding protein [Nitrosopumilus sp.]|uniref:phosphate/phosphite/phosphonate ABC transporter substrate-binding protein n=1 Tax=Nitrosopumilus sp. TaxID=2024843 RepID=UPI002623152C|nr:phosphate/phosphite/phosphonate ABC transporter substrate-binding protein [Nitrosopumilus sp.]